MKYVRAIAMASSVAAASALLATVSLGADTPEQPVPDASAVVAASSGASAGRATDIGALADVARHAGIRLLTDRAKAVVDTPAARLVSFPADDGSLCLHAFVEGQSQAGGCFPHFPPDGVALSYAFNDGVPYMYGVVDQGVESLTVTDAAGRSHEVRITGGGFWWESPAGADIQSITSTRYGKSYTTTVPFSEA